MPTPAPRGPKGYPILGLLPHFLRDPFSYLETLQPCGDVVKVNLFMKDLYYVFRPDGIEQVLIKQKETFSKGPFFDRVKLLFGEGLLTSEGQLWQQQRARMAHSFKPKMVDSYIAPMAQTVSSSLDTWEATPQGTVHVIDEAMMGLTLELALQALFGTSAGDDAKTVGRAFQTISEFFASGTEHVLQLPLWLPLPHNLRFKRAYKELEQVVTRIVEQRQETGKLGDDLLGALLEGVDEEGKGMSQAQLHDELRTLLLAGHETTALGLTFALWLLAGHPEIQQALSEEVRSQCPNRPVQDGDLAHLPLTEGVFKEAMRLYPPAPVTLRHAEAETELCGYHIPAKADIVLPIWSIQRDERYFPEPSAFKPERWNKEWEKSLPRFAYFPFGGGPRICIGMRMAMREGVLILAEACRRFHFKRLDNKPLNLMPSITMKLKEPVKLLIQPIV